MAEWWTREEVPAKLLKLSDGMVLYVNEYMRIRTFWTRRESPLLAARHQNQQGQTKIISGAEVLEENEWAGKFCPHRAGLRRRVMSGR